MTRAAISPVYNPANGHLFRMRTLSGHLNGSQSRAAEVEASQLLARVEPDEPQTAIYGIERIQGSGRADGEGRVARFEGSVALAEAIERFLEGEGR
jgi:hypothetical protein